MNTNAEVSPRAQRTAITTIVVLCALTLVYVPLRLMMESSGISTPLYDAFYIYGTVLQVLFAIVVLRTAVKIGVRQSIGRQWLFMGIGVAAYAMGDVLYTIFELFMGIEPFPSVADVFYSAEYVFFLIALVMAIRSYRSLVKTTMPVLVSGAVAAAFLLVQYFVLLRPYILPSGVAESGLWGFVLNVFYPVGDVVLILAPAVALALVVAQLGAGRLARPWWIVVAGAIVFVLADSAFAYTDWAGTGITPLIDVVYIASNLLFASAALVARDVYKLG